MLRGSGLLIGGEHVAPFGGLPKRWLRVPARALAWCAQRRLDGQIAAGADLVADPLRAYQARKLTAMRTRRRLARAIERLPTEAQDPWRAARVSVPLHRRTVLVAQSALLDLSKALVTPGPVDAQGVALARLLLSDGGSPLFGKDPRALMEAVVQATERLEDDLHF
jgi:hypothetical protein